MNTDKRNLRRFMSETNVTAVTGYKTSVDWLQSAAFEVLLFEVMLRRAINVKTARLFKDDIKVEFNALAKKHRFRMQTRDE